MKKRLQVVKSRIEAARAASGGYAREIVLVAVSKGHDAATVRSAYEAGQVDFGESYLQEALEKMNALADLAIRWHYIGPVQSNKTRALSERFDWVHSVDRLKIAERLSAQRPVNTNPLNVCVQVNVSGEASKSGVDPENVAELAHALAGLPRLKLRGLMAIPEPTQDRGIVQRRFETLAQLQAKLQQQGLPLDTLSMGMSDDFEPAIAAGSTMVRIGTAIFGARPARTT